MAQGADANEPTEGALHAMGTAFFSIASTVGGMGILLAKVGSRVLTGRVDGSELWKNLYKMAVKSLPIVVVTALFTGAIMVIQAAPIVKRYGAEGLSGGARASARCARSPRCSRRS
jgi:phospholipid/cholesterol/gamma-HCH transport system permease protein